MFDESEKRATMNRKALLIKEIRNEYQKIKVKQKKTNRQPYSPKK